MKQAATLLAKGVELGLIEAYYGKPWSWNARLENVAFLAQHGFRSYLYAPKADVYLRRRWREDHPSHDEAAIAELAAQCRLHGMRCGVGISPCECCTDFDAAAQAALERKLAMFDAIGIDDVAILFDDMRGDVPGLARRQVAIMQWVAARSRAGRLFICPTYYSADPVLDAVFGRRPADYLRELGRGLDPAIQVFWTGEEVCAREQSPAHLAWVAEQLGRKPFLWDNYPVNDGQRMSQYLHLRAFTGRPASLVGVVAGHGMNPALQAVLSRIPALTLVSAYRVGQAYSYGAAFAAAAVEVLGAELGQQVREDLLALQDIGLDRLGARAAMLRARYAGFDHPGAREILNWLDGAYRISDEEVRTQ